MTAETSVLVTQAELFFPTLSLTIMTSRILRDSPPCPDSRATYPTVFLPTLEYFNCQPPSAFVPHGHLRSPSLSVF